jgi:DNA-binding transcriptional MerR regulator
MRPTHDRPLLTTNQAAERVGVRPWLIRKWRERGLLMPAGLDERGWPLYAEDAVIEAERTARENGLRASGVDPRLLRSSSAAPAAA